MTYLQVLLIEWASLGRLKAVQKRPPGVFSSNRTYLKLFLIEWGKFMTAFGRTQTPYGRLNRPWVTEMCSKVLEKDSIPI